jgi:diguanylate cyclase (GGDEF)-like protein
VRLGGDEFVVLARATDDAGAAHLAARLRDAIAGIAVDVPDGLVSLTASVGVSTTGAATGVRELLESADLDMYRGKRGRSGR